MDALKAYLFFRHELNLEKKDEDMLNKYHKEFPSLIKKVIEIYVRLLN